MSSEGTPSLLTSNSPNFTVSFNDGTSTQNLAIESYRVNNADTLFTDPANATVNTTLLGGLGGISSGTTSIDAGGTITVAQAAL